MKRRHFIANALGATVVATIPTRSPAQADKYVRMSIGFAPGSPLDTTMRILGDKMRVTLGVPIVIDNRPSAGGRVAAQMLKSAPADGSVFMPAPIVVPVLAPMVFSRLNYNPDTDMVPVGLIATFGFGLAVRADHPARDLHELIAWMKANPSQTTFGTPASGSLPHFFGLQLSSEAGVDMVHVPFAGGPAMQTATIGGSLPVGIDNVSEFLPYHKAGRIRVLTTSGERRNPFLPDVPTFVEQDLPGLTSTSWFGLYAPPKTPATVIERVNKAMNLALADPDVIFRLQEMAIEPGGGSPADLTARMQRDREKWGPIVKASGFRAD